MSSNTNKILKASSYYLEDVRGLNLEERAQNGKPSLYYVELGCYSTILVGNDINRIKENNRLKTFSELAEYIYKETEESLEGKSSWRSTFQHEMIKKVMLTKYTEEETRKKLQKMIKQYNDNAIIYGLNNLTTFYSSSYQDYVKDVYVYKLISMEFCPGFKKDYVVRDGISFRLEPEIHTLETILEP